MRGTINARGIEAVREWLLTDCQKKSIFFYEVLITF